MFTRDFFVPIWSEFVYTPGSNVPVYAPYIPYFTVCCGGNGPTGTLGVLMTVAVEGMYTSIEGIEECWFDEIINLLYYI